MMEKIKFTNRFRVSCVAVPILLFMTVMSFPVLRALRMEQNNSVYSHEISESSDKEASASSGVISWGLKRGTNGQIPEVPSSYKLLLAQYDAKYVGNTDERIIYLTFDEGYENGYTAQILDTLKECGVKAIFFITGDYFNENAELIRRMLEEGHEVGNHSMNHPSLPSLSSAEIEEEILSLDRRFTDKFGRTMRFLRPPRGEFDENTLKIAERLGYKCLLWSFAYKDWVVSDQNGTEYARKMVADNLHCGEIMLLHAVSVDNANALSDIIRDCRTKGFEFGSPEDLA